MVGFNLGLCVRVRVDRLRLGFVRAAIRGTVDVAVKVVVRIVVSVGLQDGTGSRLS